MNKLINEEFTPKQLSDIKTALSRSGMTAIFQGGKVYLNMGSTTPEGLRKLADSLEDLGISEFSGTFSYQNPPQLR